MTYGLVVYLNAHGLSCCPFSFIHTHTPWLINKEFPLIKTTRKTINYRILKMKFLLITTLMTMSVISQAASVISQAACNAPKQRQEWRQLTPEQQKNYLVKNYFE